MLLQVLPFEAQMGLNSRVHFLKQESEMTIKDIIKINEVAKICKYSKVIKKVTYR